MKPLWQANQGVPAGVGAAPGRPAYDATVGTPIILFGAFDRHNFGDLLLADVAAASFQDGDLTFAGLVSRDMRAYGGHQVHAIAQLAAESRHQGATLIHVGGEILTCSAWQAAVMLLPTDKVKDTVTYLSARPEERVAWVRMMLGTSALAPYTLSRHLFPGIGRVVYAGVGGVGLADSDSAMRAEVLANLKEADDVSVRDKHTLAQLVAAGIEARLIPDPAAKVADLFGERIRRRAQAGKVAETLPAFPQGYLAVQFSADFGDDRTLSEIADQLDEVGSEYGWGIVFFRAGAAPWHDDLATFERAASHMQTRSTRVFESLDLWDICALIGHCRAYCGSSLHGRIVAKAFARPCINLRPPSAVRTSKQVEYAATWEATNACAVVDIRDISRAIRRAVSLGVYDSNTGAR